MNLFQGLQNGHAIREDAIRKQERIEEIDAQEAQVC